MDCQCCSRNCEQSELNFGTCSSSIIKHLAVNLRRREYIIVVNINIIILTIIRIQQKNYCHKLFYFFATRSDISKKHPVSISNKVMSSPAAMNDAWVRAGWGVSREDGGAHCRSVARGARFRGVQPTSSVRSRVGARPFTRKGFLIQNVALDSLRLKETSSLS